MNTSSRFLTPCRLRTFVFVVGWPIDPYQKEFNMPREKRIPEYFVAPNKGRETNENIMRDLARQCEATEDNIMWVKLCGGRGKIEVVQVPHSMVSKIQAHKKEFQLKYTTYKRNMGEECVSEWKFEERGVVRRTKKYKAAQKWVREKAPKP